MEIFVVLYDGSVSAICKTFDEAKQYVCREELIDECCDDWTDEDYKQYEEDFNREAFANGSVEYMGWWRIEAVEMPMDIITWIKDTPIEVLCAEDDETRYADEIARYESMCGSAEDDYYARCDDAWQEGGTI